MPVSRRACDHCRAHKLRCQWVEELASCAACRAKNKPCAVPQTFGSRDSEIEVPLRSDLSVHHPALTSRVYPPSGHGDDRTKRLEELIYELRDLLPAVAVSLQPELSRKETTRSLASSPAVQKRTYNQFMALGENTEHETAGLQFNHHGHNSSTVSTRPIASKSSHLIQRPPTSPSEASPRGNQTRLSKCHTGTCFLPPPAQGSFLLNEYLHDFNSKIPLFYPEEIYTHVRSCYAGAADHNPLTWVLVYTVFGIALRLRAMSLFAAPDDIPNSDWYLNSCLSVLPDLLLQQPSLALVQGLLGVSVLLQTSDRSQRAALFVSTAMHMAQDLAYNEAALDSENNSPRNKQEVYVFWIAFYMVTASDLHAMRPNTQKVADISVPLPSPSSFDWRVSTTADDDLPDSDLNVFTFHASLALIQAEALEELFSVSARRQLGGVLTSRCEIMISKLEMWRRSSPLAEMSALSMSGSIYRSDMVHIVILEAAYFGTLYQLHAASVAGTFTHRLDVFSQDGLKAAADLVCFDIYVDAQHLLTMAALVPQGNMPVTWVTIHALIAALCIVLSCWAAADMIRDEGVQVLERVGSLGLYRDILESMGVAALQANDPDLTSKIDLCRQLYSRIKEYD